MENKKVETEVSVELLPNLAGERGVMYIRILPQLQPLSSSKLFQWYTEFFEVSGLAISTFPVLWA